MPSGIYKRNKNHGIAISKGKLGHVTSQETKSKISDAHKGKKFSKEHKKKLSLAKIGLKNEEASHWLGDKVGKIGIHLWLCRVYGTPKYCEICKRKDKNTYDWACKNHKYTRDRKIFMRLCRSCHRRYDIKNNNYQVGFNKK